jgi:hypothetical protein
MFQIIAPVLAAAAGIAIVVLPCLLGLAVAAPLTHAARARHEAARAREG